MPQSGVRLCLLQPDWASINDGVDLLDALHQEAVAAGHSVTRAIADTSGVRFAAPPDYAETTAADPLPERLVGVSPAVAAYRVHNWLCRERFHIVCAPARGGVLLYALDARHQGLGLNETSFAVIADGLTSPALHDAGEPPAGLDDLARDAMERRTLELAEICLVRNQSVADWVSTQGWRVPGLQRSSVNDAQAAARALLPELLRGMQQRLQMPHAAITGEPPLVSVCIPHFNRPALLRQAIRSIREQTYQRIEIIVVDDASTAPEAVAALDALETELTRQGGRLVRHDSNRYPGAARNTATRYANGTYVAFLDDDDYAKPEQITTLVQAAEATRADIVVSFCDRLPGDLPPEHDQPVEERWLSLGNAPAAGMLHNQFGTVAGLFRKSSLQQLGGFTERRGVGCEDWEIYARAVLAGMNLQCVAQALFWYRQTPGSVSQRHNPLIDADRALAAYLPHVPQALWPVLRFAQGALPQLETFRIRLHQRDGAIRHGEEVLRHRDAVIAHRDAELMHPRQLLRERDAQASAMLAELSELRALRRVLMGGYGETPQAAVDTVLQSHSWRIGDGLRALFRALTGRKSAEPPQVGSWVQAARVIMTVQQSTTWDLTGPLRALARLARRR